MTNTEKFEAWFADVQKPAMVKVGIKPAEQNLCHDVALMAWQAALASQQPADDGWIEWAGGECPVPIAYTVQVRCIGGRSYEAKACVFKWETVTAYRVVKP